MSDAVRAAFVIASRGARIAISASQSFEHRRHVFRDVHGTNGRFVERLLRSLAPTRGPPGSPAESVFPHVLRAWLDVRLLRSDLCLLGDLGHDAFCQRVGAIEHGALPVQSRQAGLTQGINVSHSR